MGEVYRARDTKLKREVAIKMLPGGASLDSDRVGRFQREAQVVASLNHPNIAAIYDLEEAGGRQEQTAEVLKAYLDKVARDWRPAKVWLYQEFRKGTSA